jgi:hypothetical protein
MKRNILIAVVALFGLVLNRAGGSENGGYATAFLKIPVDARPAGMGGAYISISDDGAGQLHNPAGIQSITRRIVTSSYRAMKLDRKLGFVSILFPTRSESALGLSWLYTGYGEVEGRDDAGFPTGRMITSGEHDFGVTFAKRFLPSMALGTKLSYYHKRIADLSANSIGINLGGLLYVDSLFPYGHMEGKFFQDISVGLSVSNLVAKYPWESDAADLAPTKTDTLPIVLALGGSCKLLEKKLLLAFDLEKNVRQELLTRMGGEYDLDGRLLLRGGLNSGVLTAGAGFRFDFERLRLSIDYAFSDDRVGEGDDHVFTFDIIF